MKKRIKLLLVCIVVLAVFAASPMGSYAMSLGVMKGYSIYNERNSFLNEKKIEIQMPYGDGWYPFVMTFNADDGFSAYVGCDRELTIMYNFPSFDLKKGCSRLYDASSAFYNSFYGAYAVNGRFGFDQEGNPLPQETALVPEYDFTKLVLRDLGMPGQKQVFDWRIQEISAEGDMAGFDSWIRIDARLTVNGVLHQPKEYLRNYIQYGKPGYPALEEFAPVEMKGRIYGRYFEEEDCSVFFYIVTSDTEVMEMCDRDILRKSKVVVKSK